MSNDNPGQTRREGTGIAGAIDHRPPGEGQVEQCYVCGKSIAGGSFAARAMPGSGVVQVCSVVCFDDPRFQPMHLLESQVRLLQAEVARLRAENEELRTGVVAFGSVWATIPKSELLALRDFLNQHVREATGDAQP